MPVNPSLASKHNPQSVPSQIPSPEVNPNQFTIVEASAEYLIITQSSKRKKIELGTELPNGAMFVSFDGKIIATTKGSYPVQ